MATKKSKFAVGGFATFVEYSEDTPEDQQFMQPGESYKIVEVNDKEESLALEVPNPDFNAKKPVSEKNAKTITVDAFFDEVTPGEAPEDEPEEVEAPKAKGKTAAKGKAAKAEVEEDEAEEVEAPKAKGKAAAKAAPAKKVAAKAAPVKTTKVVAGKKVKDKAEAAAAEEEDKYGDLTEDRENEEVLALIDGADLDEVARELVEETSALDYKLGGVLFHIRKSKSYRDVDARYNENKGFELYVQEQLGLEYRKAMYLIDIYYKFSMHGIDATKVSELGWTKCAKIAAVLTEDNADDLLELAATSTVEELKDAIKEGYTTEGGSVGDRKKKVTFKFKLFEDAATGVQETIEGVCKQMGFKDPSQAFEHIIMEWAAEHPLSDEAEEVQAKATTKKVVAKTVKARG